MQLSAARSRNSPSAASNPRSRRSQVYVHIDRCIPAASKKRVRSFAKPAASEAERVGRCQAATVAASTRYTPRIVMEERRLLGLGRSYQPGERLSRLVKSIAKILPLSSKEISSPGSGFWHSDCGLSQKFDPGGSNSKRLRPLAPRHVSGSFR